MHPMGGFAVQPSLLVMVLQLMSVSAVAAGPVVPISVASPSASAEARLHLLEEGECRGCDLRGIDLSQSHLIGADLRDVDLRGADLRQADISDAVVINAFAPRVRTKGMRYAGADLTGSHLIYGGGR